MAHRSLTLESILRPPCWGPQAYHASSGANPARTRGPRF
jgi:hypothetical protein